MTLIELFTNQFSVNASRPFLHVDNATYTYADVEKLVSAEIQIINDANLPDYSHIGIATGSKLEFFIALLAIWLRGDIAVPLDQSQSTDRLNFIRDKADLQAVMVTSNHLLPDNYLDCMIKVVCHKNVDRVTRIPDIKRNNAAAILFTSGSSGLPKGVLLNHGALSNNAIAMADALSIDNNDILLTNIPFHFTSLISHFITVASVGGCLVPYSTFAFGDQLLELLSSSKATGFGGAPIQLGRIIESLAKTSAGTGIINNLNFVMSSGDNLPEDVINKWIKYAPDVDVYTVYGLTEVAGRLCYLNPKDLIKKTGSVGKAIEGMSIEIRDDNGKKITKPDILGEIYASGVCLMEGYYNDQCKTKKYLSRYGFKTGDIGRIDKDGYLYLEGRCDDVFKSSGEKISCRAIERELRNFNIFDDVCILAIDNDIAGKVPCLFYVLKPGEKFDKKSIFTHIKHKLGNPSIPKEINEVDNIPRTGSGKVDRSTILTHKIN